jgi:hypothetical protein
VTRTSKSQPARSVFSGCHAARAVQLLVCILALATGCERGADDVYAALSAREAGWHRSVTALRDQRVALTQRFEAQPKTGPERNAAARQLRVTLAGAAQSLNDVDIQVRQVRPRIEEALTRGSGEAERALERETQRMDGYFQALSGDLTSAARAVDELERQGGSASTQGG